MTQKLIKTVLILLLFASCDVQHRDATNRIDIGDTRVFTYTIDGCEYLGDLNGDWKDNYITHKGNCKNQIHATQNH